LTDCFEDDWLATLYAWNESLSQVCDLLALVAMGVRKWYQALIFISSAVEGMIFDVWSDLIRD
jgi:hypothetical protein